MVKRNFVLIAAIALSSSACVSSTVVTGPNGQLAYSIDCSGNARSWGSCFEKAGKICGASGYDVISKADDTGWKVQRNMVIQCKKSA
jgi:hypothetical protein